MFLDFELLDKTRLANNPELWKIITDIFNNFLSLYKQDNQLEI